MRVIYFDLVAGAAGDMLLSALAGLGAEEAIIKAIDALSLPGCSVRFKQVQKRELAALQAEVITPAQPAHRHLADLKAVLDHAALPEPLREKAAQILERLARIEAKVHGEDFNHVHLHELGGDDTLIDIVGVLAAIDWLKVQKIYCSAFPLTRGFIECAHGRLPLPAPATLAVLEGALVYYLDFEAELVTPTGAVLLRTLAENTGVFPRMTLQQVSYGAGARELPIPNVVRAWLGDMEGLDGLTTENICLLETNIDDLNPQVYAHLMERLFKAGALDVTCTPQIMKKNRPATLLSVLCGPEKQDALLRIIFEETTTLGIRRQTVERVLLPRSIEIVETEYGPIKVKSVNWQSVKRITPEYDDCRAAAATHNVPLTTVIDAARAALRR